MAIASDRTRQVFVIGVVGQSNVDVSDEVKRILLDTAKNLGHIIVEKGHIILTGGHHLYKEPSVKYEALQGALSASIASRKGGIVGIPPDNISLKFKNVIIPGIEEGSTQDNLSRWVYVHTGYKSAQRDPLNGQTPDVLIALSGVTGTPREVSAAAQAERPIVFLSSKVDLWPNLTVFPTNYREAAVEEEAVEAACDLVRTNAQGTFPSCPSLPIGFEVQVNSAITKLRDWIGR